MSGIDFARSDLSPDLLCEVVLKDEYTFQIPALEIFPKPPGGHSYIIADMECVNPYPLQTKISANFWPLCRQIAEKFLKYIPQNAGK